jgi:CHAT domain-containing protein/tetratricopeptide (TPR) repeat protein
MTIDTRLRGTAAGMRRAASDLGEAAKIYREVCDRPNEFFAVSHVAAAHRLLGNADSALVAYRRAIEIARRLAPLDTIADTRTFRHVIGGPATARATVEHYIGDVYRDLGRPDSAIVYYRRGEGFVRNEFDINLDEMSEDPAGSSSDADARTNRNIRTPAHATLASIADVFRDQHRPDSALAYYRRAMALARQDTAAERVHFVGYGSMNMHEARYHIGMGAAFIDAGQPDSALASFGKAQALARNWPMGQWAQRRARIDVLDGIGRAHLMRGEADSSLAVHVEALAQSRRIGDRWGETRALHAVGRLHHHHLAGGKPSRAVAYFDSAATAFAELSRFAGGDANRVTVAERGVALIEDWTLAWLALDSVAGTQSSAIAALGVSERGRAQALLRLVGGGGEGLSRGGIPSVEAEGARIVTALARDGTAAVSYAVTADTLLAWLVLPHGSIRVHRVAVSRDSLGALVRRLRAGLDVDDAAVRGQLAGASTAGRVSHDMGATRGGTLGRDGEVDAAAAGRALADLLLPAPWRAELDSTAELVFVAQGPLALVPFGLLPFSHEANSAAEPSAWGSRYAVRQAPSLSTLLEVEGRRQPPSTAPRRFRDALVAGNPAMPTVRGGDGLAELLSPLPESGAESQSIAQRLGAVALTGPTATERTVRARLASAELVHLATHGFAFASDARARDSFVALAADSVHDGLLTVGEIMDDPALRLTSDLVVLSACQSGLGDLKDAEGTIGLPRAFLARGARSVLVSLWSVSDEATRLLMERFYAHWLDDTDRPSKAAALKRASDDVRRTSGFEHPRFWAGFQVIGAR